MKEIPQNMCAVLFKMTLLLYLNHKSLSMAIIETDWNLKKIQV